MYKIFRSLACITLLIAGLMFTPESNSQASTVVTNKNNELTREIAVVFDNSGSMYGGTTAWCSATYATEVFAAMLNEGDTLKVYPMSPVTTDGTSETGGSTDPIVISGGTAADIEKIHNIYTPYAGDTPIETIIDAYNGLKSSTADKKWLVVMTDGETFYKDDKELSNDETVEALTELLSGYGSELNVQYLAVGAKAQDLSAKAVGFSADSAVNTDDITEKLSEISNKIFGRDELPASHISGSELNLDVSMSKIIVFAQGEGAGVESIKASDGSEVPQSGNDISVKYSEKGAGGGFKSAEKVDASLQGEIAEFGACSAGTYTLDATGDIKIYYEPSVSINVSLSDENGNEIDMNGGDLEAGDYTLNYNIVDNVTGEPVSSDLLGEVKYEGYYETNGTSTPISNGETVHLGAGNDVYFDISATFLENYTMRTEDDRSAYTFSVQLGNAKDFSLSFEAESYDLSLVNLEAGEPLVLNAEYDGAALTDELKQSAESTVTFSDADGNEVTNIGCSVEPDEDGSGFCLYPKYYEGDPLSTATGEMSVSVSVTVGSADDEKSTAQAACSVNIAEDYSTIGIEIDVQQDYYKLSDLEDGEPVIIRLTDEGEALTDEEIEALDLDIQFNRNISYETEILPGESAVAVKFGYKDGEQSATDTGKYKMNVSVSKTDELGRESTATGEAAFQVRRISKILLILIWIAIIAAALIVLFIWLNTKVLPKIVRKKSSSFAVSGRSTENDAKVKYSRKSGILDIDAPDPQSLLLSSTNCHVKLILKPVSPRYVSSKNRKMEIVRIKADDEISSVTVNGATYKKNKLGEWAKESTGQTLMSDGTTIKVNGKAFNNRSIEKPATLSVTVLYK